MSVLKLKVKAILFDLDGTIVDSRGAYLVAVKTALSKIGKQTQVDAELMTEIPRRLEQNLRICDLVPGIEVERFLKHYLKAYYQATATETRLIPDTLNALEVLSRSFKLALTTMRHVPKEKVVQELRRFNVARYFDYVVTALDTRDPKPSPEALVICARKLRTRINGCIVVGDSVADVRAGKKAGIKTVAVLSGIFSRQELEKENPDLIVESVKDLPNYL